MADLEREVRSLQLEGDSGVWALLTAARDEMLQQRALYPLPS